MYIFINMFEYRYMYIYIYIYIYIQIYIYIYIHSHHSELYEIKGDCPTVMLNQTSKYENPWLIWPYKLGSERFDLHINVEVVDNPLGLIYFSIPINLAFSPGETWMW